jgi:GT2 family glycosyltransferase
MDNQKTSPLRPEKQLMSVRVQSVLYRLELQHLERALEYVDNAARVAIETGIIASVDIAYGDCSPEPVISLEVLERLRNTYRYVGSIDYTFFDANLGSAAGHNRLLEGADKDLTVILNPDVLMFPNIFGEMVSALTKPGVGLVEARQTPIEHPKDYDQKTGETSWASTACAIGPTKIFKEMNGFDSETFFLYCDDVDFSWRVRLAGYKVVHQDSAMVFHDKRLNHDGSWISSEAEKYYSAEAALLLTYKYSRNDLTERYMKEFRAVGSEAHIKAVEEIERRRKAGLMPVQIDANHQVGQFINGAYAHHRYIAR